MPAPRQLLRQLRDTPPDPDLPAAPSAELPPGWELGPDGKPRRKGSQVKVQASVDDDLAGFEPGQWSTETTGTN